MKTAVAFIVFKRPAVTCQVLAAIRTAQPPMLFVIADGPRAGKMEEADKCIQVRRVIEEGVDWPCEVVKIYADKNLGCARRVSSGLDEVFRRVEEAIILEDDCLPHPTFFPFCETLLERYRDDERVAQIAGCNFFPESFKAVTESYCFSRYPHCWGWATWRRAWRHYDHEMRSWKTAREAGWKLPVERPGECVVWAGCFDAVSRGALDSWAYRWTASLWACGALSITSAQNLVTNIGFGDDATHTTGGIWGNRALGSAHFPLLHPAAVSRNEAADALTGRLVFEPPSIFRRILRFCRRLLGL